MRYARYLDSLGNSGTDAWEVHFNAIERAEAGEDILFLSVGDPDFDTPPALVEVAYASMKAGNTKYSAAGGITPLVQAIADRETERLERPVPTSRVVVAAGAQNGLYLAMRCTLEPGDEVILLGPPYVMFEGVVHSCAAIPVTVPLVAEDGFSLDLEAIAAAITPRTRAILLNSPHNPSGAVATLEEVKALLNLAQANDLWVISDEVYADMVYDGKTTSPYMLDGGPERSIVIRSLSKSHAMSGWRLGWMIGPDLLCEHARNLLTSMQYGGAAFIQHAAVHALTHELPEVAEMKEAYRIRRDNFALQFQTTNSVSLKLPESGIFCLLDISALGMGSREFATQLLARHNVSVLPGAAFGPTLDGYVRIALCQSESILEEAARRIVTFAEEIQKP